MPRPTLRDVHVNGPLTNISIAYRNSMYVAEMVAPVVPVEKKSDVYYIFDKNAWLRNRSGPRAPGTRAARADYGLTTASYICINDSLAKAVPDEVRDNADAPLRPDINATNFVTDGLLLGLEVRVANLVTACGNWANASNPGTKWSSSVATPFEDIDNAINAVVSTIGRMPNTAVMSWDVWRYFKNHVDVLDRIKHTRDGARVTSQDFMDWFGFDSFAIGTAIVDSAQEGATESISYVWGDDFWCGYVSRTPALEEPSALYCLRWGDRSIETFREEQEKQDIVTGEWFTDEIITASDAGGGYFDVV